MTSSYQKMRREILRVLLRSWFIGGGVRRYTPHQFFIGLYTVHSIIKFRPFSTIAAGNHLFRAEKILNSKIEQAYLSLLVSCDTKEHQYTFRTASYSRSHSHTAICYIAISNTQQLDISVSISCDTKKHQYTFRTA